MKAPSKIFRGHISTYASRWKVFCFRPALQLL